MTCPPPARAQGVAFELGAGVRRLDYAYRFENDSSFDTPFLVPHFFEQHYRRTAPEVRLRARYRVGTNDMVTALTVAPAGSGFGSDFDTFFQPDGDIARSGTAGGVTLGSAGIEQTISVARNDRGRLAVLLAWRRDRADFLPADRVVSHTRPPSETREHTTDRETTVSQTFEVGLEAARDWRPAQSSWQIHTAARLVPALRGRLLVRLPDKYPGRDIVFSAAGWSVGGSLEASRRAGRATVGGWIALARSGAYRRSARFARTEAAAGLSVALGGPR
jgi:hypothetical protein